MAQEISSLECDMGDLMKIRYIKTGLDSCDHTSEEASNGKENR